MERQLGILYLDIRGLSIEKIKITPDMDINRTTEGLKTKYNLHPELDHEIYFYAESLNFNNCPEDWVVVNKPCVLSGYGKSSFPEKANRKGIVLHENRRNDSSWVVQWEGSPSRNSFHKSFIKILEVNE